MCKRTTTVFNKEVEELRKYSLILKYIRITLHNMI